MPWLLKAEPESRIVKGKDVKYTIDDLKDEKIGSWDGVRNNEARKFLNAMKLGEMAFFYRSNCSQPGIVGVMRVVEEAHPDKTAADPNEPYYDPKNPEGKWVLVDFEYVQHIEPPILLSDIKKNAKLQDMFLVKRSRLSVSPVTEEEWQTIMQMHEAEIGSPKSEPSTEPQTTNNSREQKSKRKISDRSVTDVPSQVAADKASESRKPPRKLRRNNGSSNK